MANELAEETDNRATDISWEEVQRMVKPGNLVDAVPANSPDGECYRGVVTEIEISGNQSMLSCGELKHRLNPTAPWVIKSKAHGELLKVVKSLATPRFNRETGRISIFVFPNSMFYIYLGKAPN